MYVFLKLNAEEKAVCWFCGREEDDDVELVCAAHVWRGILDCILLFLYSFSFFFSFFFLAYVIVWRKDLFCCCLFPPSLSPL